MLGLMCKELGVELEEEWTGNNGEEYRIDKDGLKVYVGLSDGWISVRVMGV